MESLMFANMQIVITEIYKMLIILKQKESYLQMRKNVINLKTI